MCVAIPKPNFFWVASVGSKIYLECDLVKLRVLPPQTSISCVDIKLNTLVELLLESDGLLLNLGLEMRLGALILRLKKLLEPYMLHRDPLIECFLMIMMLKSKKNSLFNQYPTT